MSRIKSVLIQTEENLKRGKRAYHIAREKHATKSARMCHYKERKQDENKNAHAGPVVERCIEKNATAARSLWLLAEALQAEDQQTISIVHIS